MRTVAIVGSQSKTRGMAPWGDPTVDIWVFNEAANLEWCQRADVVFQLHAAPIYRSPHNNSDPTHWQWLQKPHDGLIVYMQDVDPLVPCAARYPLEEIAAALLPGFRQGIELTEKLYFTSSVAYALALAIYQEYDKILIYGVEMGSNTEYTYQRPCVLFWVGCAIGRGIAVDFVSGDDIFDAPLYGYDGILYADLGDFTRRAEVLRAEIAGLLDSKTEIEKRLAAGALNGNLGATISALADVYGQLGNAEGRLREAERYAFTAMQMIGESGMAFIDRSQYEVQIALHEDQAEKHKEALFAAQGVINYLLPAWNRDHHPQAMEAIKGYTAGMCRAAYQAGKVAGVCSENLNLIADLDRRLQAAGGEKAAERIMEGQASGNG